jgi:argininosuccinate lyase
MLWGGRFKEKFSEEALEFSSSLSFDINRIEEDLLVSKAHAEMLSKIKIITVEEAGKIIEGLNKIEKLYKEKSWNPLEQGYEDIHSAVESKLFELIGETAGKMHTGRSRNDQVAADLRLFVKRKSILLKNILTEIQKIFLEKAEIHIETLLPGYTHLQRAQPVSLAFHLLAYVEMFERDKNRLDFIFNEADISPFGSGAIAGSTLPLDRKFTAEKLGFSSVSSNAMDSVSDRDFILDFLNCCSTGMIHLSRLAEEIILWSSSEWSFIKLRDKYSTGSSLMPQKKNPDLAELIRGKTGRVLGNYLSLAATLKGLPLSYNRDLQEDKEPLFNSMKTYFESLRIAGKIVETMEVNSDRFKKDLKEDFSLATDLADWLVLQGIPFRKAHQVVGEVVKYCEEENKKFYQIKIEELIAIDSAFLPSALEVLDVDTCLYRKKTIGSPNPDLIKAEIKKWKQKLL